MSADETMKSDDLAFVGDLELPIEFPTTYFPCVIEQYRQDLISHTAVRGDFAAAGMLAALSVGVGNSVAGRLGTKRFVPTSLYLLMVGPPGSGKSPALSNTLEAIRREQAARVQAALQPILGYRQHQAVDMTAGILADAMGLGDTCGYGNDFADDDDGESVGEAVRSPVRHLHLTDATIPGVREALIHNPRGIVVAVDEAVSLFKGAGKGCDRAIWLELWNAESTTVSRRSGKPPIITIPRCFVTLIAGTQPDIFPQLRNTHGDDGLLDRLMIFGDRNDGWPKYSHCNTNATLAAAYNGVIDRLLQHRDDGSAQTTGAATVLPISEACSKVFEDCHNHITAVFDRARASLRYGGLITKTVANATRLAVLRSCSRWAAESPAAVLSPTEVTEADAVEACKVALFSLSRALLWRPELVGSAPPAIAARPSGMPVSDAPAGTGTAIPGGLPAAILDYVSRRGINEVEVRKLRSCGSFGSATTVQLRAACDALVDAGRGRWLDTRKRLFGLLGDGFGTEGGAR